MYESEDGEDGIVKNECEKDVNSEDQIEDRINGNVTNTWTIPARK